MDTHSEHSDEQVIKELQKAGEAWEQVAEDRYGLHPVFHTKATVMPGYVCLTDPEAILLDGRRFTLGVDDDGEETWMRGAELDLGMRVLPNVIRLVDDDGEQWDSIAIGDDGLDAAMAEAQARWAVADPEVVWHWRRDLPVLHTVLSGTDGYGDSQAVTIRWRPEIVEGFDDASERAFWPVLAWDTPDNPPVRFDLDAGSGIRSAQPDIVRFRGDCEVILEGIEVERCDDDALEPGCYWVRA